MPDLSFRCRRFSCFAPIPRTALGQSIRNGFVAGLRNPSFLSALEWFLSARFTCRESVNRLSPHRAGHPGGVGNNVCRDCGNLRNFPSHHGRRGCAGGYSERNFAKCRMKHFLGNLRRLCLPVRCLPGRVQRLEHRSLCLHLPLRACHFSRAPRLVCNLLGKEKVRVNCIQRDLM